MGNVCSSFHTIESTLSKSEQLHEGGPLVTPNYTTLYNLEIRSKSRSISIELDIKTNYHHPIGATNSYTPEDANLEDLDRVNAVIASHRELLGAGGILSLADSSEYLN